MDAYVRLLIQTCHKWVPRDSFLRFTPFVPLLLPSPLLVHCRVDVLFEVVCVNHRCEPRSPCLRRKVAAMGGMSAQIPIKNDQAANDRAMAKVKADKLREVTAGHDGTWVAHPALIKIAMDVFDEHMKGPNQVSGDLP
jgi:hypothetical protein